MPPDASEPPPDASQTPPDATPDASRCFQMPPDASRCFQMDLALSSEQLVIIDVYRRGASLIQFSNEFLINQLI